ncbi:[protein-PII] uridylyltransferase [Ferriphaselus sp. R-1]|uniref:[protein-PII] uridylyltransferase n=1 Tax=Ferriphaselus sp. R-1 TaxID=1485544 RepID=UPI0005531AA3|nr:[protein-PII] uridylyltransferase [Ferriphaselus sp. R-1]
MTPAAIRSSLKAAREALQRRYADQAMSPQRLLRAHAGLVDEHLRLVWQSLAMPPELVLAAVGGYGRGELFPKSDIDLLILLPEQPDAALQERLRDLVGTLWDIGLEVGHSIRTVGDCMAECSDVTVQTNLLEARLITGAPRLFEEMRLALSDHLNRRAFFLAKQQEQGKRHSRFLDIDYNLEPNLKESPGGLRDLQTVLWISRASGCGSTWRELAAAGLISTSEARAIARHEALLQTLRIRLHYLARRREDRLLFDHQAALAEQMGIRAPSARRASEQLMQRYYRTRRAVRLLNEVLLQALHSRLFPESGASYPLNARFIARDTLLEARDEELFQREPAAILECFLLLQQHPRLTGLAASTLRALWRARPLIDAQFRRAPHNRAAFMRILRQPQGLTHALRLMNRLDVLGRYLPPFGRIVGQLQHDLFHIHTVDEHILMVVRNLRRFTLPELAHEFPLCSRLIHDFARPEVLYIAGLFHDIAKGRGGDHSLLGRADADRFCRQHGLSDEDRELVIWLVEQHLAMSAIAQKQDLSDQDVIAAFAARIRNERHLVALYLLTVADVRGTSPKVWNAWKGKLLEDLFNATRRYLSEGKTADQVGETRMAASQTLALYAIAPDSYQLLWAQLESDYFLQHEPHEIAWHTRLLAHRVNTTEAVVKARLARIGEGLQVMVYSPDRPQLFVRICSFFADMNYNIVEAKVHTTQHGYALDSFLVMDASGDATPYRDVMSYIEHELAQQIDRGSALAPASQGGRINRQLKHFPIAPEVVIEQDEKGRHLLSLVAGDRPGLLARIARILSSHAITVRSAKINTLGSRAEDTFWITGAELATPARQQALRDELLSGLT